MLVPAFSEPKSLLHEFELHGATRDQALTILPRAESAAVNAVYVFSALQNSAKQRQLTDADVASTVETLIALGYINPRALTERFNAWAKERRRPRLKARFDAPLLDETMLDWIEAEGDSVCRGAGTYLRARLSCCRPEQPLEIEGGASVLGPYPSVDALLLYGIRDLMKVLLNQAPLWGMTPRRDNPRAALSGNARRLGVRTAEVCELGMSNLASLFAAADADAQSEFTSFLSRYTAYVFMDVELGRPFLIEFSRLLPVGRRVSTLGQLGLAVGQTRIRCPLAPKDAQGVHVVVALHDPEVRFGLDVFELGLRRKPWFIRFRRHRLQLRKDENGRRYQRVENWTIARRQPDGGLVETSVRHQFGTVDEASEQLVHLYSSRGRYEGSEHDDRLGSVRLVVALKLTKTVFWAYLLSALAFALAAIYVNAMWWRGVVSAQLPPEFEALASVNALAVTLSLWLTTTQHRRPIVHKKLLPARYAFFVAIFFLLLAPTAYGVYALVGLL